MVEREFSWKERSENSLIGTDIERLDGVAKASGTAKYTADTNTKGTLFAKLLTCPHGSAKVKRLNTDPARKVKGVRAVHVFNDEGAEVRWDGTLIAAVAADRPEMAEDGCATSVHTHHPCVQHLLYVCLL